MGFLNLSMSFLYTKQLPIKQHFVPKTSLLESIYLLRGVGAKLEVVRQNFRAVSKFHDQNWRIHIQLPKATQLPKAAHARGVWGHAPQENFEFQRFILDSILGHFGLI